MKDAQELKKSSPKGRHDTETGKKIIEIRWGDVSHISNKGDGCPFRPLFLTTYHYILLTTSLYTNVKKIQVFFSVPLAM